MVATARTVFRRTSGPVLVPPNPLALELFRIALGGLIGLELLQRYGDLRGHYASTGVLPFVRSFFETLASTGRIDLFLLADSLAYHHALFAAGLLAAVAFCLGVQTRLASLVLWLVLLSVQNRNPFLNEGADIYVRVVLFWSLFLPLGQRLNLAGALAGRRPGAGKEPTRNSPVTPLVLYAYSIQIGLVYLCSFLVKASTAYWREGRGLELALQVDVVRGPGAEWLLPHAGLLSVLTWLTLAIQLAAAVVLLLPTGLLVRARLLVLAGLVGMHVGIVGALSVGLFPFYAAASLLPLVPTRADWRGEVGAAAAIRPGAWTWRARAQLAASALALGYVFVHLLAYYELGGRLPARIDTALARAGRLTGLHQHWIMFSGIEYNPIGWVVGRRSDGSSQTIFSIEKGARQDWDRGEAPPPYPSAAAFSGYRWKKLYVKSFRRRDGGLYRALGVFLCAETARLSPESPFDAVDFGFVHEKFADDFAHKQLVECHRAGVVCASGQVWIAEGCP